MLTTLRTRGVVTCLVVLMLVGAADAEVMTSTFRPGDVGAFVSLPCLPDFGEGGWLMIDYNGLTSSIINTEKGKMRISANLRADVAWDPADPGQTTQDPAQAILTGQARIRFSEDRPLGTYQVPIDLTVELIDTSGIASTVTITVVLTFDETGGLGITTRFPPTCS